MLSRFDEKAEAIDRGQVAKTMTLVVEARGLGYGKRVYHQQHGIVVLVRKWSDYCGLGQWVYNVPRREK